jgi:uncharacterized protein YbjT (DUF2867 family)
MFVIAGASWHTGKAIAQSLLDQKRPVRVVTREAAKGQPWQAKGAEVAVANLGDADALTEAFRGAQGAFLLVPRSFTQPDFRAYQDRIVDAIARAVEVNRIPHAVFLSSMGAQHPSGTGPIVGLHLAEQRLRRIKGTVCSFVRGGYFMENIPTWAGARAPTLGTLALKYDALISFIPEDLAIDMIAVADVARLATTLLLDPPADTNVVEIGGPPTSMRDAASAIGRIIGRPVIVEQIPREATVRTLVASGGTENLSGLYREMLDGIVSGHVGFEGGHRRVLGTTSLEAVIRNVLNRNVC